MTGILITFEGLDGSGKSTQAKLFSAYLKAQGHPHITTREPGGTSGAEKIRSLLVKAATSQWAPLTEAVLLTAARIEHVNHTIRPALADGLYVICDRFTDSTIAYQGYGHGLDLSVIESLNAMACGDIRPHITFILDLPVRVGLNRKKIQAAPESRFELMSQIFHDRVAQGYQALATENPKRCYKINASQPINHIATIIQNTWEQWLTEYNVTQSL